VPDGEAQDDDLSPLHSACRPQLRRDPGDDDDSEPKRSRPTCFMVKMSSWMESRGRSKHRASEREMGRGWYHGESSVGRRRALLNSSPPPPEEKKALWWLWQAKEKASTNTTPEGKDQFQFSANNLMFSAEHPSHEQSRASNADVIIIEPSIQQPFEQQTFNPGTDVIVIKPTQLETIHVQHPVNLSL
jgi:hypothetical protein